MKVLKILFLLLIVSCKDNFNHSYPEDPNWVHANRGGKLGIFNDEKQKYKHDDNLWAKTLAIISNILPINILDDKNLIIVTEWGNIKQISHDDNLYKINIYIKDIELKRSNLIVSVFKKDNDITLKDLLVEKKIEQLIFENNEKKD